ncbi:hypothetical protein Scep_014558 [Stephania cephalantha]|uniref:Uncharacterized protein n=1 Tax=Stephania cephalantha TaxID=152367 RepID=A0AAP0J178_9MAGN
MSPLFLKIGTSVLLLQSIGIRFDFKILLKSFVNQVNPISPKHFQTSMSISSRATCFPYFHSFQCLFNFYNSNIACIVDISFLVWVFIYYGINLTIIK